MIASRGKQGIKRQLILISLVPILGFAFMCFSAFKASDKFVYLLNDANDQVIPTFDSLGDLNMSREAFSRNIWAAIVFAENAQKKNEFLDLAKKSLELYQSAQVKYDPIPRTDEEDKIYLEVRPIFPEYYKTMNEIIENIKEGSPEKIAKANEMAKESLVKQEQKIGVWLKAVERIYKDLAAKGVVDAQETQHQVATILLSVAITISIFSFAVLYWIAGRVSRSVSDVTMDLFNTSEKVAEAIAQLNVASSGLSTSSVQAAASMEETVASIEEVTSMIRLNCENANQAAALSGSSKDAVEKGRVELQKLTESMNAISASSKKIEEIISVIDDIAFQTNLLALNAAVEAARAGEQGKGFAVVAEAVRALAQRSAASAKDISHLIKDSVGQIESGAKIATQSTAAFDLISQSIKKVADLNSEISTASTEQTTGISQISKAMNHLDQSTQANAASSEEIAASSTEIASLAVHSKELAESLRENILGSSTSAA